LAISYLRMGEQLNCQQNHNDQSCIIPITGKGIYSVKQYSEMAIEKYLQILTKFPEDMQSRWLLNLSYMTLDQYPDKVPSEYLIDVPELSKNPIFKNVATGLGVDHFDLSGSVICDDFDNDKHIDIIVSSWGTKGRVKFYKNNGDGTFTDITKSAGLSNVKGGLNIKQTDYNNDGHLDLYIMRGAWKPNLDWGILPNSLLKNNGDGSFTDVTVQSGLYTISPTQSAEWFDCNNDGHLDLIIANETTPSAKKQFPCQLYINDGDGHFSDQAAKYGANKIGYFKGCSIGDINNDGWMDIYLSNLNGANLMLKAEFNQGKLSGYKLASSNTTLPNQSFPCWFFDVNNDGWEDLFAASYDRIAFTDQAGQYAKALMGLDIQAESSCLYLNNSDGTFSNVTQSYFNTSGYSTMGCNYGDINNDGYQDFYLGTGAPDYRAVVPNRLFENKNGQKFVDQSTTQGVAHIQKGHGISFADLDNDGDQDIYAVMGGAFEGDVFSNALFENTVDEKKSWIKIKLQGQQSNHAAIGAKIKVSTSIDGTLQNPIYKTVNSGASFGANPLIAHIGLGDATDIDTVYVKWPNGLNAWTSYTNLTAKNFYHIIEGQQPQKIDVSATPFNTTSGDHQHDHSHH
ncbi:CRTAC1 family protein, partial [Saprospiraceae bacterium]|nr:CRTAC1 family protein [Saprospiraceae bacterium]